MPGWMREEAKLDSLQALNPVAVLNVPDAYSLLATLVRIKSDKEASRRRNEDGRARDDGDGSDRTLMVIDSASGCLGYHLLGDGTGLALANQVALTLRRHWQNEK